MIARRQPLVLAAMVLLGLAPEAFAQSTRERLDSLESRATQLESVLQGAALVELAQGVSSQESELRTLRGELEALQQQIAKLRREQLAFAADVDRRLKALETRATATAAAPTPTPTPTPSPAPTPTPQATPPTPVVATAPAAAPPSTAPAAASGIDPNVLYGQGFDALKARRYDEAIETLKSFRVQFPTHPLADNATYWLGQMYFVQRDYALALEAFTLMGERSSDPAKAPDALLKKGLCELELRRPEAARASFTTVITRFPDSNQARQARAQLDALR